MKEYKDQMNQTIRLSGIPRRIVSLVPSQTELLYDLGLGDRVIGITKFCIYPDVWYRSKDRVGGTKNANYQKIRALKPDLIIGNKEENEKENIEQLMAIAPVWMSDISNLDEAMDMISRLGELLDKKAESNQMIERIRSNFSVFSKTRNTSLIGKTVLYVIWNNPIISVGENTFIDDMLRRCGMINYTKESRYPVFETTTDVDPDYVFLSSEPFPFKEKHIKEIQIIFSGSKVILVDGELFSWYGSRLLQAPDYFQKIGCFF